MRQWRRTTPAPAGRRGRLVAACALSAVLAVSGAGAGLLGASASAAYGSDDDTIPSQQQVDAAQEAAGDAARSVATVQTELVLAHQRTEDAAIAALQAEEAFLAAKVALGEAKERAALAAAAQEAAEADVARQQEEYEQTLTTTYQMAPELTALSAIIDSDGIATVVDRASTLDNAEDALGQQYDDFRAAASIAESAADVAADARAEAADLASQARTARRQALAAQSGAAAAEAASQAERDRLIGELADLQGVSRSLAEKRQEELEARAAKKRKKANKKNTPTVPTTPTPTATPTATSTATPTAAPTPTPTPTAPKPKPTTPAPTPTTTAPAPVTTSATPTPTPTTTVPAPTPTPTPTTTPTAPPPAPSSGAAAAIAFARAQIGKPYKFGASGPGSYDCSGLTMQAWAAGGKALPHSSAAQYAQSAHLTVSQLQPGDLVFWGSSPSSIYHVALYVGGGRIVHAPRTGQNIAEVSMYYWIAPSFFARP